MVHPLCPLVPPVPDLSVPHVPCPGHALLQKDCETEALPARIGCLTEYRSVTELSKVGHRGVTVALQWQNKNAWRKVGALETEHAKCRKK